MIRSLILSAVLVTASSRADEITVSDAAQLVVEIEAGREGSPVLLGYTMGVVDAAYTAAIVRLAEAGTSIKVAEAFVEKNCGKRDEAYGAIMVLAYADARNAALSFRVYGYVSTLILCTTAKVKA